MNLIILFLVVSSKEDNNVNSNGVQKKCWGFDCFSEPSTLKKPYIVSQNFNGKNDASLNGIV